jgi:RNA polymerase sigma-70 factor (sigma-E family)
MTRIEVAPASFTEYVAARSVALQRFAYLVTGDFEDAKDVVQDALMAAFPRWERIAGKGDPTAYLKRSIVNSHISNWRKFGAESPSVQAEWADRTAPDQFGPALDKEYARRLFAELPLRQRTAVVLRCYEGCDYPEIAEICGCTEGTARSLVSRALAALRDKLPEGDGND